tara:strand:- start:1539 stop:2711 length:1173 start_codon:yes stop_codon:yes gene_type:complete
MALKFNFAVLFGIVLIVVMLGVNVLAVGVTPAYYIVDFESGYEGNFIFNFIFNDEKEIGTYVEGDLAEYVELDKDILIGGGEVTAYLKLPDKIDKPGQHRIRIGAKQIPREEGGLEVIGDVRGIIKVNVPYPGKHLDGEFHVSNANVGEELKIKLIIENNGEEDVSVSPVVRIYNSEGDVENLELEEKFVKKTNLIEYNELLSTENLVVGDYNATAVIEYDGKKLELETGFRLGDFYVEIVDYTKEFERDKVNRFEIDVLSFYNGEIENLYANVTIIDEDVSFLTPSVSLKSWSNRRLEGFFDTAQIEPVKFEAEIVLHYDGGTTREVVQLKYAGEIEAIWYFVWGGGFALVFGLIWWFARKGKWKVRENSNRKGNRGKINRKVNEVNKK